MRKTLADKTSIDWHALTARRVFIELDSQVVDDNGFDFVVERVITIFVEEVDLFALVIDSGGYEAGRRLMEKRDYELAARRPLYAAGQSLVEELEQYKEQQVHGQNLKA